MQETNNNMGKYNDQKELIITKNNFRVEIPNSYIINNNNNLISQNNTLQSIIDVDESNNVDVN